VCTLKLDLEQTLNFYLQGKRNFKIYIICTHNCEQRARIYFCKFCYHSLRGEIFVMRFCFPLVTISLYFCWNNPWGRDYLNKAYSLVLDYFQYHKKIADLLYLVNCLCPKPWVWDKIRHFNLSCSSPSPTWWEWVSGWWSWAACWVELQHNLNKRLLGR